MVIDFILSWIKKMKNIKHGILGWCFLTSLILLFVFLYLQHLEAKILSLDTKWLVVAGVPLLIALIAGGYIKRFKGFGIELESLLRNPIGRVNVIATDVLEGLPFHEKGTYDQLQRLSDKNREKIKRLSFISGKKDYYGPDAVNEYLEGLPYLEYFEVKKADGCFLYIIPVDIFKSAQNMHGMLERFIRAMEENNIAEIFGDDAIGESVAEEESLVSIVPKIRENKFSVLPVVSSSGRLIGIVNTQMIESRITDEVIAAQIRA